MAHSNPIHIPAEMWADEHLKTCWYAHDFKRFNPPGITEEESMDFAEYCQGIINGTITPCSDEEMKHDLQFPIYPGSAQLTGIQ